MTVKVTFEFATVIEAVAFMNQQELAGPAPSEQPTEQPVKRARKSSKTEPVAEQPAVPAPTAQPAPVDNLAALMGGEQPAPAKAVTQKDLITAFVNLGNKSGPAAIKAILSELGAATVNAIPQEKWGEAVAKAGG